nr:NUDIX domain-containing protein [Legionella maioricensis]
MGSVVRIYHVVKNIVFSLLAKRTVGVRILLIKDEKILLVKHTYQPDWYTIGGGVESGETPRQAIERELQEEVGVVLNAPPELFSVYYSRNEKRDDYIIFYIGHAGAQELVTSSEIAEQQWFPANQLPPDLSPATRRRIQEYFKEIEISERW